MAASPMPSQAKGGMASPIVAQAMRAAPGQQHREHQPVAQPQERDGIGMEKPELGDREAAGPQQQEDGRRQPQPCRLAAALGFR